MFIKPRAGVRVRNDVTRQHLPESGADVPETTHWLHRLADGDVELATPSQPKPAATPAAKE